MIAFWILYCLVISASYSGELRAYMINPSFTSPISTLQQVVDSGLPWGMVLYGEEEEEMMAASEDPVIKRIWNEKYVEVYSQTPKGRYLCEVCKLMGFIDTLSPPPLSLKEIT